MRGHLERARRRASSNRDGHAERELARIDRQRLRQAFLLQVDRLWIHRLDDGHAVGRLDGEDGRDERRIARLMRLDVHPFGQPHAEGEMECLAGFDARDLVSGVSSALTPRNCA